MRVDSRGIFSIALPGDEEEWTGFGGQKLTGTNAEELEREWAKKVREYSKRTRLERKVIVIRYDSSVRDGGKRNFFTNDDCQLLLEAYVCLEVTTRQGDKDEVTYIDHPDYAKMHGEKQPFPWAFQLSLNSLRYLREDTIAVEWSQEIEDTLVRACLGIRAIADLLERCLNTPEALIAAVSAGNLQLPQG